MNKSSKEVTVAYRELLIIEAFGDVFAIDSANVNILAIDSSVDISVLEGGRVLLYNGKVLPLINYKNRIYGERPGCGHFLILSLRSSTFALWIDRMIRSLRLRPSEIKTIPRRGEIIFDFFEGVISYDGVDLCLIDIEKLFASAT